MMKKIYSVIFFGAILIILEGVLTFWLYDGVINQDFQIDTHLLIYSGIAIGIYLVIFLFYAKIRPIKRPEILDHPASEIPLDTDDLINFWWWSHQRGIRGLLRSTPPLKSLKWTADEGALLFEARGEAEFYKVSTISKKMGYSEAQKQQFFSEPINVDFPTTFEKSTKIYPVAGTLKKQSCMRCGGQGKSHCSMCSSTGKSRCTSCGGSGSVTRTQYNYAKKTSETRRERCISCSGSGQRTCTSCQGTGKQKCSSCGGEGYFGEFQAQKYEFKYWRASGIFKYQGGNVEIDTSLKELIEAKEITLDELKNTPHESLISDLSAAQIKFEGLIQELENVLFDRISFFQQPSLTILIDNKYKMTGRGFKPLEKYNADMDTKRISIMRLLIGIVPLLILPLAGYLIMTAF